MTALKTPKNIQGNSKMNYKEKLRLVENMRRYGGNFVRRLADAMIAADPVNYKKLCDTFPDCVKQYSAINNTESNLAEPDSHIY